MKTKTAKPTPAVVPKTDKALAKIPSGKDAPVKVHDDFGHAFDLACGLDSIVYCACCSDTGISKEGAVALSIVSQQLVDCLKTVKAFLHGQKTE